MNVSLTPELENLIQEKVSSGLYNSASEVVRDGLRLLQDRDEIKRVRLEELRKEINQGIEAADRGDLLDGEEFLADLRKRHEDRVAGGTGNKAARS